MVEASVRPIVVGVDGSTAATHAVSWAAREAVRRDVPLVVVHACALVPVAVPYAEALVPAYHRAQLEYGREWLDAAESAAREAAPDVRVSTDLARGSAAEQLIARSASAELVVLGSRGLGGFTGLVVGSIAVAVATYGHCPIVVVRGADAGAEGPVVLGVDGSPTSAAAIPFAFRAAASRGVPLVAVHTWLDTPLGEIGVDEAWDAIEREHRALVGEWLAPARAEHPDVPVEVVVARHRPAHTLLDQARNAQLVVVGSRGRGGFRGLLLGSTSHALIYHAACPVAVVPPPRW
ncbi:universal stress protein [Amycolatopsis tolypomycina]|uniref:Nucleotide-binding universal stress protein, UspA family n=1 Tax=Amycolatopsis tolypomycina TaxID=208445 RepID=A0A1H4U1Y5_9PSEU|nr:universal stress protein [Amycolatopsis tolypomycina]SEC62271.1 Nucleotide-binding universal stress protein, UspA family [Amycolatopsis tolypomycina]